MKRRSAGLTLIELMIVVALIGVLSSIAIPNFLSYQARSRRAEAFTNLAAIAALQKSFQATKGVYHTTGGVPWPGDIINLGAHKHKWDSDSENAWGPLGWRPEGDVYYSYGSDVCCASGLCFTAAAYGDVDADGNTGVVMYVEPEGATECPALLGLGTPIGPDGKIIRQVAVQASIDQY